MMTWALYIQQILSLEALDLKESILWSHGFVHNDRWLFRFTFFVLCFSDSLHYNGPVIVQLVKTGIFPVFSELFVYIMV